MAEAVVRLRVDASGATRALNGVQAQTNKLQSAFGGLRTALGGIGLTVLARNAIRTSTNFEKLNVRLGLLTKASGTFARSQEIAADAQKAFGLSATEALEGITDITARLAPLNVGVEDIKSTFFGFNTAAKLAGASTIEASNAFRQLAQALGSGRLAGDEFRSISEQIPTLLAPIADELNVNVGELKKFAAEGKLTSEVVLRALRKIESDGGASLRALIENDPTQVFKNLTNETENLSRAFGDLLKPAVLAGTKELTKFIEAATEFVNSDAGQASFVIAGVVLAVKGLTVAIPAAIAALAGLIAKLQIAATASALTATGLKGTSAAAFLAAGGITKMSIALVALKTAIAATGIGLLVIGVGALATKLIEATKNQREFNKALEEGDKQALKSQLNKLFIERQKLLKRLATARENNNKRAEASLKRQLVELNNNYDLVQKRLLTEIDKTNEIDRQNKKLEEQKELQKKNQEEAEKLKEKMTAVGEEIESSIKSNLKDSITGAQSFGEAMRNVLNRIRDKIIESQIEKLLGGFGENFGKSASGGKGKGIGGFLGGLLGGLFANGGSPPVGKVSVVGERGPELFVPKVAGTIIPNNAIGRGGTTNNMITVNVDASGTSVQGSGSEADQLGGLIASVVQATIIDEQRAGGLLNR